MRRSFLAIALSLACVLGCAPQANPPSAPAPAEPEQRGIEIEAPGVDVKIERDKGIEVQAPGVEVDAKPKDGEVKVDTETPK
jgi:hypothetical protein